MYFIMKILNLVYGIRDTQHREKYQTKVEIVSEIHQASIRNLPWQAYIANRKHGCNFNLLFCNDGA